MSVHLAKRFQRRIFKKKSANQKQELPVTAMFVWLYAACLEYFIFFSIDSSEARKQYDEYCLLIWPNVSKLGRKHPWKVTFCCRLNAY
jgi:hypothetical protein